MSIEKINKSPSRALHFGYFQKNVLILKVVTKTIPSEVLKMGNKNKRLYERFFAWIIPCAEIYFELEVVKN